MSKENQLERNLKGIVPVNTRATVYKNGVRLTIPLEYTPEKVIEDIVPEIHKIYGYGGLDVNYSEGKTLVDYFPLKKEEEQNKAKIQEKFRDRLFRTGGCFEE